MLQVSGAQTFGPLGQMRNMDWSMGPIWYIGPMQYPALCAGLGPGPACRAMSSGLWAWQLGDGEVVSVLIATVLLTLNFYTSGELWKNFSWVNGSVNSVGDPPLCLNCFAPVSVGQYSGQVDSRSIQM